jgi:hypothetical protein
MKYDAKFKAYCRRVVRNAEVAVTAKRKTRKGLDAIRTLGALALALTVLTPAAIAQDAPRTGFEISAVVRADVLTLWSKKTFKTQAACEAERTGDDHVAWVAGMKDRAEGHFGEGKVSVIDTCVPAQDHPVPDDK